MDTLLTESMVVASLLLTSELLQEPRGKSAKTVCSSYQQDITLALITCASRSDAPPLKTCTEAPIRGQPRAAVPT